MEKHSSFKYVFLKMKTRDGEREYYHFSLHTVTPDTDLPKWAEELTSTFWGDRPGTKVDDSDWYDFGEVWTQWLTCKEITKAEYDILERFIV